MKYLSAVGIESRTEKINAAKMTAAEKDAALEQWKETL